MRDWQCCSPWRVKWLSCEDTRLPKKVSLLIGFLYFYRNSRASQEMYLDPCTNCFLAQLTTKKETTNLTVIPREPQGTNCGMNPSHEMTRVVQNTYGVRGESKSTPCASNPAPACVLSCWGLHIALLLLLCHRSQGKKSTFGTRRACLASPAHWQSKVNPTEQRGSILPSALGFRALWVTYPSPIAVPWGSVKYRAGFPALLSLGSVPGWMSGEQPPLPIRSPAERCWLCLAAHARQPPSAMPVPLGMCPLSLPFSCSPSRQHALTLRGVEMSAGMWAGKKRKQILRLVQTYSCLYWSLGVTSERGEYKHQQDPLGALKPANMRLRLEKQLLILSLLCILSKVRSRGAGSLQAHAEQHQDSHYGTMGRLQCCCSPDSWQAAVRLQSSAWERAPMKQHGLNSRGPNASVLQQCAVCSPAPAAIPQLLQALRSEHRPQGYSALPHSRTLMQTVQ